MKKQQFIPRSFSILKDFLTALLLLSSVALMAQPQTYQPIEIGVSEPFIIDIDLRDLPPVEAWQPGDPVIEFPQLSYDPGIAPAPRPNGEDPYLEMQRAVSGAGIDPLFGFPIINRNGQGFTGVTPPDTVGAIGKDYYIQAINAPQGSAYTIYNKGDGSVAAGPFFLDNLGAGVCASGQGDPIILYDNLAGRWLLTEFAGSIRTACVYVSQTDDPISGGWFAYTFTFNSSIDYPKYGIWPDGYYITSNSGNGAPNIVSVMDRVSMLAGLTATNQTFTLPDLPGYGLQVLQPADFDGPNPPPPGTPHFLLRQRDDEIHNVGNSDPTRDFIEIFEWTTDFATPANTMITGPFSIPMGEIDGTFCGQSLVPCIPQPNGGLLHPLKEFIMHRAQYRNFGTHETIVGACVTDVDGTDHAGTRWFELRRTGGAGAWSLHQEGTIALDEDHRWASSISMDKNGNIALAYNTTGPTTFTSIRYIGRKASDPLGTMPEGEHEAVAGTANNSSTRWGDYSAMTLDPVDDETFWFTGEYNPTSAWATRITAFKFQNCLAVAPDGLMATAAGLSDIELSWSGVDGGSTTYNVYRGEGACGVPLTQIASGVNGTTFNDNDVTAGVTYSYAITTVLGPGCESTQSTCQQVTAPACTTLQNELENWFVYLDVRDLIGCLADQ